MVGWAQGSSADEGLFGEAGEAPRAGGVRAESHKMDKQGREGCPGGRTSAGKSWGWEKPVDFHRLE